MKNILLIALFLTNVLACKTDTAKQNQSADIKATTEIKADSTHVHTYVCPMDSDVKSNKEGEKCPKCGMALVHKD